VLAIVHFCISQVIGRPVSGIVGELDNLSNWTAPVSVLYKLEAQASESLSPKSTRLHVELVKPDIPPGVALSSQEATTFWLLAAAILEIIDVRIFLTFDLIGPI
jgi:hypothetical protein